MKIKAQDNKSSPKEWEEEWAIIYTYRTGFKHGQKRHVAQASTFRGPPHQMGPPQNEDKILYEVLQLSYFGIIISQYFKTL